MTLIKNIYLPILSILLFLAGCQQNVKINNPYEHVDWSSHLQYKGNFHTHTTQSDGWLNPQTVVDKYHALGYKILSITDHNVTTWPWIAFGDKYPHPRQLKRVKDGLLDPEILNYQDRYPERLNMIAIKGNELSKHYHDVGSFFNDFDEIEKNEEERLIETQKRNGLVIFFHPGRYNFSAQWYIDKFQRFPHAIGFEIYNQGNKYPDDRQLWDSILTQTMPDRSIWGYSNDDMHIENELGRNWNSLILPELNEKWVRKGMEDGLFFYVYSPKGHLASKVPEIQSIDVDQKLKTISIQALHCDSIHWISSGGIVAKSNKININELFELSNYVRAELFGSDNVIVGTQPFGIVRK